MQTNDVFSDFLPWLTSPCGHLWQAVIGVKVKTHINGTSAARLSDTVGRNPAPVEKKIIRLSHYLQGLCIPGGAGFPPSIVSLMESGTCITNTHTHTSRNFWQLVTTGYILTAALTVDAATSVFNEALRLSVQRFYRTWNYSTRRNIR